MDAASAFSAFYTTINELLDRFYPFKTISTSSMDPQFVTPEIKYLLRRKNKLQRSGNLEAAACLATRIGRKIASSNASSFSKPCSGPKDLGSGSTKSRGGIRPPTLQHNLMQKCSTDTTLVCQPTHIMYHRFPSQRFPGSVNLLAKNKFFRLLDVGRPTASGTVGLPHWYLRVAAPFISTHLWGGYERCRSVFRCRTVFRMFHLSRGSVSSRLSLRFPRLHHAPISGPLQSHPYCLVYSRRLWYDPSSTLHVLINKDVQHLFMDQFAFRPTGSTTCRYHMPSPSHLWNVIDEPICTPDSLRFFQGFWYCPPFYHDGEIFKFPHTGQCVQLG